VTKKTKDKLIIESRREMVRFDLASGVFDVIDKDTGWTIANSVTAGFNGWTMNRAHVTSTPCAGGYLFSAINDECKVKFDLSITVAPHWGFITLEASVTNLSGEGFALERLSPFMLTPEAGGTFLMSQPAFYRQGFHSWEESRVLHPARYMDQEIVSHWMTALHDGTGALALLLGFTTFSQAFSHIRFRYGRAGRELCAISDFEGINVPRDRKIVGERCVLACVPMGQDALFAWTEAVARTHDVHGVRNAPVGWCSWYHAYDRIDETYIMRNIADASLIGGLDYVQIDDGYQKSEGDWLESNEKFPRGIPCLLGRIKEKGLKAGLWIAPFMVSPDSGLFKDHPGWLIKDCRGAPAPLLSWRKGTMYGLDCSHPEACEWLRELFTTLSATWAVDLFKLDFLYLAGLPGRRHRRSWTGAQCYRKAMEIIRGAMGPSTFVIGCGAPLGPSVGWVDAMRISGDVGALWKGEFSVTTSITNTISRFFMHRTLWLNDPDSVILRDVDTELTEDEVKTLVTVVGLSGGLVSTGDDIERLSPARMALLKKLIPPYRGGAIPPNFFSTASPDRFDLRIERTFAAWHVIALINWDDRARDVVFSLATLGMRKEAYLVYDFWEDMFLGIQEQEMTFTRVPPHATKLLCVRTFLEHPQLMSTDLHITQGGVEIGHCHWKRKEKSLDIRVLSVGPSRGKLLFYVPHEYAFVEALFDEGTCDARERSDGLLSLTCEFTDSFQVTLSFRENRR
jgi:hypothetical protein